MKINLNRLIIMLVASAIVLVVSIAATLISSCTNFTPKQNPPVVIAPVPTTCVAGQWCKDWDLIVRSKLTADSLNTDFSSMCKDGLYSKPDLWAATMQSIAWAESSFNPKETYEESFIDDTTGKKALSVGIFQLSSSESTYYKQYPACLKINAQTLFDPEINTGCAIEIAMHLVKESKNITSLGRYWSTFRSTNKLYNVTTDKFYQLLPRCK